MRLAHVHHDPLVAARSYAPVQLAVESEGAPNVLRSAAILSALMLMLAVLIVRLAR